VLSAEDIKLLQKRDHGMLDEKEMATKESETTAHPLQLNRLSLMSAALPLPELNDEGRSGHKIDRMESAARLLSGKVQRSPYHQKQMALADKLQQAFNPLKATGFKNEVHVA